ncbi:serine hydrolase domain-containing protein [Furfurilactobacillus siliginis]|uniref:Beta-lactamase class C related penicillin binding protein n=1 Tax=Furfurilactobacillus siliginis TaxID=348151 RepID=A0A0R2KUN9_9LACO|nr:serine hydrolase domain-containing protein [Furfurilactobacillus siliginis]KRN93279.1 Beta-lactamase class C related penicillin binding protein [Furfurilactobacillus siliginis]GEK29618.1 peptidase S12 [Furfurilactobacillus siliginis]
MSRKVRLIIVTILILLGSVIAWGTLYHEVRRTTRSVRVPAKHNNQNKPKQWRAAKLPVATDNALGDNLDRRVKDMHFVGSMLVVRQGKVVFERQYGQENAALHQNNASASAYAICSIQKIATGALVMQQVEQHKLSLSDHISKFYPELPHANDITIRQMLDMTSGLKMDGPVGPTTPQTDDQIVDYDLHHVQFDQALYNNWQYAQVNYNILTGVLKKLSGKTYEQLFNQQIIRRFNLQQTVFMPSNDAHVAVAYGADANNEVDYTKAIVTPDALWHDEVGTGRIAASARDLYVMISDIMKGKLISPESVKQLYQAGSRSTYGGGTYNLYDAAVNHGLGYGYQGMSCVSNDGQNAVIMLSNSYRSQYSFKPFSEQLFLELFKK